MDKNNLGVLIEAGVIPEGTRNELTDEDLVAIESLSQEEVSTVISVTGKLGDEFFKKLCPHGAFF